MENRYIKLDQKNVFYPLAFLCSLNDCYNDTEESFKDSLVYTTQQNGQEVSFVIGKVVVEKVSHKFLDHEYTRTYEDFANGERIVFNRDTLEVTISDGFLEQLQKIRSYHINESLSAYVMQILAFKNPYLYEQLTLNLIKSRVKSYNYNCTPNLLKNIMYLDKLEGICKNLGRDFLIKNLQSSNFSINGDKKNLKDVMDLPLTVANEISKLKIEEAKQGLSQISAIDPNYAILMVEFLSAYKRVWYGNTTLSVFTKNFSAKKINSLCQNIASLLQTGYYSNFKSLLNYLIRESYNYGELQLPVNEATELLDYITMVTQLAKRNPDLEFDYKPRNIDKAFRILRHNSMIMSAPRAEEFKEAVKRYSYMNFISKDNYVFMVPESEEELFKEGNVLRHCVANYRDKIIDENVCVVFMRHKDDVNTPFITIEYENGVIVQIKQKFDEEVADMDALNAANLWAKVVRTREKKAR